MNTDTRAQLTHDTAYEELDPFLKNLVENPPTTSDEHEQAANTLLRFAAHLASFNSVSDYGKPIDPATRAAALAQMAAAHLQIARS